MNRAKLKSYAPQARRDFIQAMTDRAAFYGLTANKIEPVVEMGDVAVIAGREHPRAVAKKRTQLEDRIKRHGFEQTMEALAYTWFNRLVAIRFMEVHGYLDHGYRVLSSKPATNEHGTNTEKDQDQNAHSSFRVSSVSFRGSYLPEILVHAEHVDLPGLKKEAVIDLKLAGNKEAELYRLLLTAQCNALHAAMPFLFEKIEDETELLLPDNLLHSDSLIRKLVGEIDEEDWQPVEIIGWLYQFYISEKKDEVIGKVVASEDIPAATQLFTPNWIVKYLVQNTLGRQWLATYPDSSLRKQMPYYIEPAEQTPEVQEQLKALTPTSLNPEELTLLDPACGSGHILVEAYDLFKAIYQERGYRAKDIPALILQKNLFGLEIDDRAAQLAAFALMMKARADDRRIFDGDVKPNIVAFEDSKGMIAADITHALNSPINKEDVPTEYLFEEIEEAEAGLFSKKALGERGHVSQGDIASLLALFENAKTFGSLIQVPPKLAAILPEIKKHLDEVLKHGDLAQAAAHVIKPLLQQARLLAKQYDAVVANPPYMGNYGMNSSLKEFAKCCFPNSKWDLYSLFAERLLALPFHHGHLGLVTPFTWMYARSFEHLRNEIVIKNSLLSLVLPESHSFFDSAFVSLCAYVVQPFLSDIIGDFIDLSRFYGESLQPSKTLEAISQPSCGWRYRASRIDFATIPGIPIVFSVSKAIRGLFLSNVSIGQKAALREGIHTGKNALFLRLWHEIDVSTFSANETSTDSIDRSGKKWIPHNKGGQFRKWYGNNEWVIRFDRLSREEMAGLKGHVRPSQSLYFKEGGTWTALTIGHFAVRYYPAGFLFDSKGQAVVGGDVFYIVGMMNCGLYGYLAALTMPSMEYKCGHVAKLPFIKADPDKVKRLANSAISIAKTDWDSFEQSWEFGLSPLALEDVKRDSIEETVIQWSLCCDSRIARLRELQEENNRLFIEACSLQGELSPEVPDDQITLYRPNRAEDIKRLLSYALGCMMGRYSLDKPGLIYAQSGNRDFDPGQYKTFRADDDGIIPLLETDWGIRDDATNRIVEFVGVAWPKEHLEENLKFVADSLGPNNGEQPRDTIRRYLATGFYKHHLSMYKKRPIYWLFSSGKQRAFQCLVYLHRYHEGTLARMRTEYVIPLQGQIAARIEQLEGDKTKAGSTSHRNKLQKEQNDLKKQQAELFTFEEKLKHAADQKISLDLDDGVKVNYGKFGDLLAESKAITGGKEEE